MQLVNKINVSSVNSEKIGFGANRQYYIYICYEEVMRKQVIGKTSFLSPSLYVNTMCFSADVYV